MKKISYEEFKNSPRLFKISNKEIKSDYKKYETQQQHLSLMRRYNSNFKKKKRFELKYASRKDKNSISSTLNNSLFAFLFIGLSSLSLAGFGIKHQKTWPTIWCHYVNFLSIFALFLK